VKAVVYHGPRNVSVDEVPDAKIEKPTDALVRITATNICGSDLHMYEGRTDFKEGRVFGHENVGEVIGVGDAADKDRGAECVGYQAHDPRGHEDNSATLNDLVSSVRFTGGIGTVGVYVPQDPGGPNELAKHGKAPFDFGSFWFKGQHMGAGQCPVKRYNRYLRSLIAEDKVKPSWIVYRRCWPSSRWISASCRDRRT